MTRAEFTTLLGGAPRADPVAIVVEAPDAAEWTEHFVRAVAGTGPVFLANPDWGEAERVQFRSLIRTFPEDWDPDFGWLMIPTGGSSGAMKLARHDQATLLSAATGAAQYLGMASIHSLGTLPRHHIGGLMAWLRSVLTGGLFINAVWRRIAEGGFSGILNQPMVISLVPTQLGRLKQVEGAVDWLRQFAAVLVGGAALSPSLARWAREEGIRLCPTYAATETAAMAAALSPDEFLGGRSGVGKPLPHIQAETGPSKELRWSGSSLFRGYWPERRLGDEEWVSGDLGSIDEDGNIHIHGRADGLINSGGEKINPVEVEIVLAEIWPDGHYKVLGIPHAQWGECVVVAHEEGINLDLTKIWTVSEGRLAKFKWPKFAVPISNWPVNALGKIDMRRLRVEVNEALSQDRD